MQGRFGKYRVGPPLRQRGEYVTVYRAAFGSDDVPVELHVLKHRVSENSPDFQRFLHEFQTLSGLSHPGIVKFLDFGMLEDRVFYATVATGAATLLDLAEDGRRFGIMPTLDVGRQTAAALAYLHDNRILHRNVAPDSVFWHAAERRALLGGFCLAKNFHLTSLTIRGFRQPTEPRMSPERARGADEDERTDLFLLGDVLYWMLTGRPALTLDYDDDVPVMRLTEAAPSDVDPDIPAPVDEVVMRLLDGRPERRYRSAVDLEGALEACRQALSTM